MNALTPYAKALVALVVTGIGAIATGYADDTLTKGELWAALAAAAAAGGAVFGIGNADTSEGDWDDEPDSLLEDE